MTDAEIVERKDKIRALIAAHPLTRDELLSAKDVANLMDIPVSTIYVWHNRGHLIPRAGRYDWRQVALCKIGVDRKGLQASL